MLSQERIIDTFIKLVKIDSPSGEEKQIADYLVDHLKDRGLEVKVDNAGEKFGGNAGNIVAYLKGNSQEKPITFCAHMDQVSPCRGVNPIIDGNIIRTDGTTTLGADDKLGIAIILEALEDIIESNCEHRDIYILFTVSEEDGLLGAKQFTGENLPCKDLIVLDYLGKPGAVAYKAPAMEKIKCTFKGKKAHAGIEPEKGINAIVVASDAISNMHIGRIDELTTSNIGRIEGGGATNIVTDSVTFTAEIRSHIADKLQAEIAHMENCCREAAQKFKAEYEFIHENCYPPFSLDLNSDLYKLTEKAMLKERITPEPIVIGGGSDANILAALGYKSAILSIGMYEPHAVTEYLKIDEMWDTLKVVRNMMDI